MKLKRRNFKEEVLKKRFRRSFKEDILQKRYNIESNVNITGKKHKSFAFTTPESIKAILTELYSTLSYNKLFLQRKFDKFQEFLRIHNYV